MEIDVIILCAVVAISTTVSVVLHQCQQYLNHTYIEALKHNNKCLDTIDERLQRLEERCNHNI